MSVNYFLYAKNQHQNIKNYLEEITKIYEDMIQHTINENENLNIFNKEEDIDLLTKLKDLYLSKINESIIFCKVLKDIACQVCNHNFITDTIDIDPDTSKQITYCTICEYTK